MSGNVLFPQMEIASEFEPQANVVLYHGLALDFLRTLPDASIQLVITSPPYNVGKEYEKSRSLDAYLAEQEPLLQEIRRVLKETGSLCWQVGNYVHRGEVFPLDVFYYPMIKRLGFKLRNRIVWHFGHGLHAKKRFSGRYETLLWFTVSDTYVFNLDDVRVPSKYPGKRHFKGPKKGLPSGNPKGKNPSDIWKLMQTEWETGLWDIPNVKANHPEKTAHPAQFPIELAERCVLALTHPDDWVLDPYAGAGTSLIAAIKQGRRAAGSEKEAKYVDITRKRLSAFWRGELKIRPLGKPVYQPTGKEKIARIPDEWKEQMSLFSDDAVKDRRK